MIWPHWLALSDENNTWTALIWMMTLIRASYSFIAELHLATLTQVLNWIDHWTGLSWIMKLLPFVELPIAKWNSFQRWISPCFWSELNDHWIKLSLIIHCLLELIYRCFTIRSSWVSIIESATLIFIPVKLLWSNLYFMKCYRRKGDYNDLKGQNPIQSQHPENDCNTVVCRRAWTRLRLRHNKIYA